MDAPRIIAIRGPHHSHETQQVPQNTHLRRTNVQNAFQAFAEEQLGAGQPPKGLEQSFASLLQISPALWSMVKSGARQIGDKLARQIEDRLGKEKGWLDEQREPVVLSSAEQHFLAISLSTYRRVNAEGRRRLKKQVQEFE